MGVKKTQMPKMGGGIGCIDLVSEDVLEKILSKLPAVPFSSAACVSRTWNRVCNRVLFHPKFDSALSLKPSLQDAVKEVLDKVLSYPIRPHFAIACVGLNFSTEIVHEFIKKQLGSKIPIIVSETQGIIGTDASSNEFMEVHWRRETTPHEHNLPGNTDRGITLMVGFVPGMKIEAIPLLRSSEKAHVSMVDKFVTDIKDYAASVSSSTSPEAIILFGDKHTDMRPVSAKLDYAMSQETAIVGDECGCFHYTSVDPSRFYNLNDKDTGKCCSDGIALVFARDREKPEGIGETRFHVMLSNGLSPVGYSYKAVSVKVNDTELEYNTWLTARREGFHEVHDGERIMTDIEDELEDEIESTVLYIGVTKRRKCAIGPEKPMIVTSLDFHEVSGENHDYLIVDGKGIRTGDVFHFYRSDSHAASSSCSIVSDNLRYLKQLKDVETCNKKEVCGSIIITCAGRGDSFFGRPNVDSSPFVENFPGVPVIGLFCAGEIGRGTSRLVDQGKRESNSLRCYMHVFSTVYLVMSYSSPS